MSVYAGELFLDDNSSYHSGVEIPGFFEERDLNHTISDYRVSKTNSSIFSSSTTGSIQGDTQSLDLSQSDNYTDSELTWQKCLGGSDGDGIWSVHQTTDGGYLVGGYSYSNDGDVTGNHGFDDAWIVKLGSSGNLLWQKALGGSGFDSARSTIQTADGGYFAAGFTGSDDGNVSGNHGGDDFWAVKLDASGNLVWQKALGGSDDELARSAIQTTDGGYLVGGHTYSNDGNVSGNHGSEDYWIVKLDSTGTIEWQKCLGGSSYDEANSVIQTTDRGYLIGGYTYSNDGNVSGNHGRADYWIVKLDSTGTIEWQKCLGGSSYDEANSVIQVTDGGYLIGGTSSSDDGNVSGNHGASDAWVVKLDSSGAVQWQKCLGGSDDDGANSIIQTTDGGYLVGGYTYSNDGDVSGNHGASDFWVVKLDPSGAVQWQKCLGGSDYDEAYSIIQTTDGRYLAGGDSYSMDGEVIGNHGSYDYWLAQVTTSHPINATADPWTIVFPAGNRSYIEGTNATYLTQAKPGSDLVNVSIDNAQVGPVSNWTFTTIVVNHTISTSGIPTPGQVHAFFTVNTTWGAVPLTVVFTNQSLGSPTSFYWTFGDGTSSTDQNPVHTYATPGTYSVTLKAMNDQTGGIATLDNAVTVTSGTVPSPTPTPVPGKITAAFSADQTTGSAPLQVMFSDDSTGNPTSWLWELGDGNLSTSQNITHIYSTKGAYSVTLSTQNSVSTGNLEKRDYVTVT